MHFLARPAPLRGTVAIPGSKSHTIRGVLLASLAEGESILHEPLASADTQAAVRVYQALGARFQLGEREWRIHGVGPHFQAPPAPLDVANSGTTMNVALGTCALLRQGTATLTGDHQIQRRPSANLAAALNDLGARIVSERGNGCPPFHVQGTLRGGRTSLEAPSSQYVTSLLFACPLADGESVIDVPILHERPYVQMTLDWLAYQGIALERDGLQHYRIPGGQTFRPFTRKIPADFSTATFFLVAGTFPGNRITCTGLDLNDAQADKAVVTFLRHMGADITVAGDAITVTAPRGLQGQELDLNDCPDALPMMAVCGCFAEGTTKLVNVAHARIKETDRIAVMAQELRRLGAEITERPDGLVIQGGRPLRAATVDGHADHRVVMSLALAGTQLTGTTRVATAEAAAVTCPDFRQQVTALGGLLDQAD